uniref:trypsin n=1 Tax=Scleropages formosus TaxID=113540 RepID=A0A8C9SFY3_SCLFO
MRTSVFAVLIVAAAVYGQEDSDKIIGGYECPRNSQKWQVFLTYDDGQRWCGGSLINKLWVVSAAHCYIPAPRLAVHLGEHDLYAEEGTEQRIFVEKAIRHPGYSSSNYDNDIMLIKLKQPAVFNEFVHPIPLASSCARPGEACLVSGWGNQINTGVHYAAVLQCLNLPILSESQCRNSYGSLITDNMLCAGFLEGGKDSCQGDSGGPLVCHGQLQGVVSWGSGCAEPGYPGVYAEVCRYIDWINNVMASN